MAATWLTLWQMRGRSMQSKLRAEDLVLTEDQKEASNNNA